MLKFQRNCAVKSFEKKLLILIYSNLKERNSKNLNTFGAMEIQNILNSKRSKETLELKNLIFQLPYSWASKIVLKNSERFKFKSF